MEKWRARPGEHGERLEVGPCHESLREHLAEADSAFASAVLASLTEVQGKKMGVTVFYKSCWGRTYAHCCAQEASGYAVTKGILSLVSKQ